MIQVSQYLFNMHNHVFIIITLCELDQARSSNLKSGAMCPILLQFSKSNMNSKFQKFILSLKIPTTMITDQRDNISLFDINQSIFFVLLQFKKSCGEKFLHKITTFVHSNSIKTLFSSANDRNQCFQIHICFFLKISKSGTCNQEVFSYT